MPEMSSVEEMWDAFVNANPQMADVDTKYSAWHFCDNEADANELAELVQAGQKRATAGALWAYEAEGEAIPLVGDFSVITDWDGRARCIIRATAVDVVPFEAVSTEFASAEGEGDGSLEYWREVHWAAFGREMDLLGMTLTKDMPVVCERFDVVFGRVDPEQRAS